MRPSSGASIYSHRAPPTLVALDAISHRRLIRLGDLADYTAEKARWPGARRLYTPLELVDARTESPMETRLRLLLHDAGANGAQIGRVDLAYPRWKIALEYEGDHHRELSQFRRDITRVNALRQAGWIVLRFTADDVRHHPQRVIAQVTHAIQERR